jgi:very-short-patch-repair endonuclease
MQKLAGTKSSRKRAALLAARAHGLRASLTLSEQRLWAALRNRQLGAAFRRQMPVGEGFIADFLAPALKLVVEVDGSAHEHRRRGDARRDETLHRLGFEVLRIEGQVVMHNLPRSVELVRGAVRGQRESGG